MFDFIFYHYKYIITFLFFASLFVWKANWRLVKKIMKGKRDDNRSSNRNIGQSDIEYDERITKTVS